MKQILFFVLLSCFAFSSMAQDEEPLFMMVEEMPEPKDGMKEFYKYIVNNLKYPASARKAGIQGRVFLQFNVEKDGSLTDIKVIKGIHTECDAEAIRVLEDYPNKWNAGKQRGKNVRVKMSLPILFKLNSELPPPPPAKIPSSNQKILVTIESQPQPKEGLKDFYKYIAKNLKYPKSARRADIEGKVFLQFIVTEDGSLTDIKVIRGIHPDCDAEAIRVLEDYPDKWIPGTQRGKNVKVRMSMPIVFKLGKSKPKSDLAKSPLFVIDGNIIETVRAKEILAQIKPQSIVKIDILKGEEAREQYGEKAKYGVVIIKTKNESKEEELDKFEGNLFPNPAKDKSTLSFELQKISQVKAEIYNIHNPKPQVILDRKLSKGKHAFDINTSQYDNGIYIIRITNNEKVTYEKLLIEK